MDKFELLDALVIGAGMAGLAAARALAEAGQKVIVLEASQRVGGRIFTRRADGEVIELGAEFVHGQPADLCALIVEAGLSTYELTGDFLRRGPDGALVAMNEEDEPGSGEDDPLQQLKTYDGPDCSFTEYLEQIDLDEAERTQVLGYVEGFNAADAREASVIALGRQQKVEDEIDGDRVWRIREGYDRLPEFLKSRVEASGGNIVFGARVEAVTWTSGRASVRCAGGRSFDAPKLIVALPLGVLQGGAVAFHPMPPTLRDGLAKMRMGQVCRLTMVFRSRLWPEAMSFLMAREMLPSVWWTARPADSLTLTGWIGGPRSQALLSLSHSDLEQNAIQSISEVFRLSPAQVRAEIVSFHTHDWQADEQTRGAYSWVPVGGADASAELSDPIENTLFFAGEHTDTSGHWGTVHGALRSGLRAARQALGST